MANIIHQPCPFVGCGSSDAFDYEDVMKIGTCRSCGTSYPAKATKHPLHPWAKIKYPLSGIAPKNVNIDEYEEGDVLETSTNGIYLEHRGISNHTMQAYNCLSYFDGDTPNKHTYIYPDGGTKTRVFPKEFYVNKFKADQLYGMNLFPAGSAEAVTITEGELDAMSAYQMLGSKYPVVSLPSATPSKKLLENCKDWLGSFKKIYLSLDADDKADKFATTLMHLFPSRVFKVPHDKFKDANEFLQAGCGEQYRKAWWSSGLYTPENIYATEEKFLELLHDTPEHSYIPTGIEALDEKILGLMQGHFTVIKAPTGIGKSEFMRYLEYNFISKHPEVRFATWHLEETKLRSLLGVVSYYLKDDLTRKDLIAKKDRMQDVEDTIKHIVHNTGYMQFHLDDADAEGLIEQIRVLTQVYGCQYVFFEPIQDVVTISNDDSKEALLADLSVRLSKLAADLNVGIVTIGHTNDNGDFKYCRMIGQRASVIIDLERDKEADNMVDRNTTTLIVKKNRPCGLEGKAGELMFDGDTFTLSEKGSWE